MSYAVIRTGGKQYRVAEGSVIRIERLESEVGAEVEFDEILAADDGASLRVGTPTVAGAKVTAQVTEQGKARKILVYKKKRRKNYRRRYGHRQPFTAVRVTGIEVGA